MVSTIFKFHELVAPAAVTNELTLRCRTARQRDVSSIYSKLQVADRVEALLRPPGRAGLEIVSAGAASLGTNDAEASAGARSRRRLNRMAEISDG